MPLAEKVLELDGPTLVLGDLNATSWSPAFADLTRTANLHDSRRGYGLHATWPANAWHLRIPIDHALVSSELVVLNRRTGPAIGSDHLPVLVDVAVRRK